MPYWRKTIFLKDLLSDGNSDEAARAAAERFAQRLKRLPEHKTDDALSAIVSELEDIAQPDSVGDDVFGIPSSLCDWFNAVLGDLYDWADRQRVLIAGKRS